jgi:hypothetical protein
MSAAGCGPDPQRASSQDDPLAYLIAGVIISEHHALLRDDQLPPVSSVGKDYPVWGKRGGLDIRRLIESSGDLHVFDGIDLVIATISYSQKVWI